MTDTDRIARMARESGLLPCNEVYTDDLARFARLVAEDCAKVCDDTPGARKAAVEIRARYGIE